MRFHNELEEMRAAVGAMLAYTPNPTPVALPHEALSHAAQAIHTASGDLLDMARFADRPRLLTLQAILHGLLERLTAVDELTTRRINGEIR